MPCPGPALPKAQEGLLPDGGRRTPTAAARGRRPCKRRCRNKPLRNRTAGWLRHQTGQPCRPARASGMIRGKLAAALTGRRRVFAAGHRAESERTRPRTSPGRPTAAAPLGLRRQSALDVCTTGTGAVMDPWKTAIRHRQARHKTVGVKGLPRASAARQGTGDRRQRRPPSRPRQRSRRCDRPGTLLRSMLTAPSFRPPTGPQTTPGTTGRRRRGKDFFAVPLDSQSRLA